MKRASGILLPVFSLPSRYGIGCFSKEAYRWVDALRDAGQSYWQILPLSHTGFGDSPYQAFSSFAGNPYYIDLDELVEEGLLTRQECDEADLGDDPSYVDYGKQYANRMPLLRTAYERSEAWTDPEFVKFTKENAYWLDDYALFMAVKKRFGGACWNEWAEDIRNRWGYALDYYRRECYYDIEFYKFLQFKFMQQWKKLKSYANDNGIEIIGDIPMYVAYDSADTWACPQMFQLDDDLVPTAVSGVPPDAFSDEGQLWGNPLYRWDYHKSTGFDWWCQRIAHCFDLYDVVRIDHFRGFDEYFAIPYGDKNALRGHWEKGPGMELFFAMEKRLGRRQIIAEDLGILSSSVRDLLRESGYPGMKVLEFAFDPDDMSDYLPHRYDRNCVVYTGTHDNEPLMQWYEELDPRTKKFTEEYLNNAWTPEDEKYWDFIRLAMMSCANTCIIPLQDYLGLGKEARINFPSTFGNNWKWRICGDILPEDVASKIFDLTRISDRMSEYKTRQKREAEKRRQEERERELLARLDEEVEDMLSVYAQAQELREKGDELAELVVEKFIDTVKEKDSNAVKLCRKWGAIAEDYEELSEEKEELEYTEDVEDLQEVEDLSDDLDDLCDDMEDICNELSKLLKSN